MNEVLQQKKEGKQTGIHTAAKSSVQLLTFVSRKELAK
jgi:hypothetical protein